MTDRNKLKDRARDELFSHINRCGVLQAEPDDQEHWMEETMEYLAERYPDLNDTDLKELYTLGLRFCRPAIPHGRKASSSTDSQNGSAPGSETGVGSDGDVGTENAESQGETVAVGAEESPSA
jgi:hypothetical protein